jgi:prefoldin subunit 5
MQHLQIQSLNASVKDLNRNVRQLQQAIVQLNQTMSKLYEASNKESIHRLRNLDEKMSEVENHLWHIKERLV